MNKTDLSKIAKETRQILMNKHYSINNVSYDISHHLKEMINNTKYYESFDFKSKNSIIANIEITQEKTNQAAYRFLFSKRDNVVILNFASATCPGGGWLFGARAQEEDLCRKSSLWSSIRTKTMYYNTNIKNDDHIYTDGVIYSPNVLFFRDDDFNLLEDTYYVSVITSPAPNLTLLNKVNQDELKNIIQNRALKILQVAADNNHKNLILGAWGCGAFGNDPNIICEAFHLALSKVKEFENVCFAIYDSDLLKTNYSVFNNYFRNK